MPTYLSLFTAETDVLMPVYGLQKKNRQTTAMNMTSDIFNALRKTRRIKLSMLGTLALSLFFASCEPIYDDQSDCRYGRSLRFIFDYHMEPGANAFPANVDCVDVLVFDQKGNFIKKLQETSDALRDESYRMELELDPGSYHLIVWGGTACADNTFTLTHPQAQSRSGLDQVFATLNTDEPGVSERQLHDIDKRTGGLFYGTHDFTIDPDDYATSFKEEVVNVMKNTNNIQVMLQELNGTQQTDYHDYTFRIVDDNFILDANDVSVSIATETVTPTYKPYGLTNRTSGYVDIADAPEGTQAVEDTQKRIQVATAEFSTSRLLLEHAETARLVISTSLEKEKDGSDKVIIDIPLIDYLLLTRGMGDSWIKDNQEYLDRQSRWTMMFFLQRNVWVNAKIVVNSWVVRVNDIEVGW